MLRFSMQIYKNKMKDEKMWEEKVVIHLHFLWPGLYRRMIQEVKMALVFAFLKLLSVICYLYRKKIIFGNCQLSTVTLGVDVIDPSL